MVWELKVKSDAGTNIEMTLNSNDASLWETINLVLKTCTGAAMTNMTITIKKVQ